MSCQHVFGNISGGFRGISCFLGNFAGFHGNTWISRVRDRAKYQKPCLNEQSCDTLGCLFKTGVTVVVNGLGPKAKFQGKNFKSKVVDFYLFLSFIPIHFFSPCYISITSQFYRQHSLVKPGRMQKDWAGMSRLSIQFSSQMSNFSPVSLAHLTEWHICI